MEEITTNLQESKGVGMQVKGVWRVAGSHAGLRGTLELLGMPIYIGDVSGADVEGHAPMQHCRE